MKPFTPTVLLLALALATPRIAAAQAPSPSEVRSARVRVYRRNEPTRIGTLVSRPKDLIVVQWLTGAQDTIPTSVISKLEVSNGKRRFAVRGALVGLVAGAGVGLLVKSVEDHDRPPEVPSSTTIVPRSIVTGVTLGVLLGAMGTDDWQTIPVGPPMRVGLVSDVVHHRFGLGVSRSF